MKRRKRKKSRLMIISINWAKFLMFVSKLLSCDRSKSSAYGVRLIINTEKPFEMLEMAKPWWFWQIQIITHDEIVDKNWVVCGLAWPKARPKVKTTWRSFRLSPLNQFAWLRSQFSINYLSIFFPIMQIISARIFGRRCREKKRLLS